MTNNEFIQQFISGNLNEDDLFPIEIVYPKISAKVTLPETLKSLGEQFSISSPMAYMETETMAAIAVNIPLEGYIEISRISENFAYRLKPTENETIYELWKKIKSSSSFVEYVFTLY